MVKPENVATQLKDKYVMTGELIFASGTGTFYPFIDWDNVWEVIDISVFVTVNYIASQAVALTAGVFGALTKFLNAATLGTAAVAAGGRIALFQPALSTAANLLIPKATPLIVSFPNAASQTGKGIVVVKIRPVTTKYSASKRPGGAAQAAT